MRLSPARSARFIVAAFAAAAMVACSDPTASSRGNDGLEGIQVTANVTNTSIDLLVVTVSATDISRALIFNLPVTNGIASGTLRLPAGDDRTLAVKAFDVVGEITHDASVTLDVQRGQNPPLRLSLLPRNGQLPVDILMGPYSVVINPASHSMNVGGTTQLAVAITEPNGTAITSGASWATSDPSVATVSGTGLVTAKRAGSAQIVATYGGVAGMMLLTISDAAAPLVIVGPVYPPPGGVTFAGSGVSGIGTGRMQVYTGLNLAATRFLAFGVDGSATGLPGLAFDGNLDPAERMSLDAVASNPGAGMMRWVGVTSVTQVGAPNIAVPTRLTLTLSTGAAGSEVPAVLTPTAGTQLPANVGWVVVITSTADLRMNVLFEAFYNGAWGPALTVYDAIPFKVAGVQSRTSLSTGFFYSL